MTSARDASGTEGADAGATPSEPPKGPLSGVDEGERISVTDGSGTIARFEMAYSPRPDDRFAFGPPLRMRIPSFLYLGFALVVVGLVIAAHLGSSNTALYVWVIEKDKGRVLGSGALAAIVFASGIGTVIRAHMRGVIVRADGVEARYLLAFGVPRIKRWAWSQIERIIVDERTIMFEMWNGDYERMPEVAETRKLSELLGRIAAARHIRVTHLEPI